MSVSHSRRPARRGGRGRALTALLVAPLLAGGCLFGGGGSSTPTVAIRVENNLVPAVELTISVIPSVGSRRTVGVVAPSQRGELQVPVGSDTEPYRLLAESGAGPAIASRQFTLSTASVVEWNVGQNTLNVSARR